MEGDNTDAAAQECIGLFACKLLFSGIWYAFESEEVKNCKNSIIFQKTISNKLKFFLGTLQQAPYLWGKNQ